MTFVTMFWLSILLAAVICAPRFELVDNPNTNLGIKSIDINDNADVDELKRESDASTSDNDGFLEWLSESNIAEANKYDKNKQSTKQHRTARSVQNRVDQGKKFIPFPGIEEEDFNGVDHTDILSDSIISLTNEAHTTGDSDRTERIRVHDHSQESTVTKDSQSDSTVSVDMLEALKRQGIDVIENDITNEDHFSHKSGTSSNLMSPKSYDTESLMNFAQSILTHYERAHTKRSMYDDGPVNQVNEKEPIDGQPPLYHRYTAAMTLKDIYLKMGGVCTLIEGFSLQPIYVISTCPRYGLPNNIQHLCERASPIYRSFHKENIIDLITTPVQDSRGFVYKNVYCAQCNDVPSITAWSTKLDCDDFQSVELSDGRQQVRILDQFADNHQGCQRQLEPVINRMLHECPVSDVVNTMNQRAHDVRFGENSKADISPFPLSYSILMNFGFDGKTHILFTTQPGEPSTYGNYCNDDEMYDPTHMKCRAISCNEGYELIKGKCQQTTHYESDTITGDLSTIQEVAESIRITLTIQNASILDLTTLYIFDMEGKLEEVLQEILSSSFNISKERIQNVTITLFNASDAADQLSQDEVEIYILATARSQNPTNTLPPVLDRDTEVERDDDLDQSIDVTSGDDPGVENEVQHEGKKKSKGLKDKSDTNVTESSDTLIPQTNTVMYSNMSVNISFILHQAHRNRTYMEKSTKSVVKSMSDLVESNLFVITINGTNFPIVGVYNVEDVQSMDKFCEYGHVTDYYVLGDEFVVTMEYIPELSMNITMVYVNRTGRLYIPGEYDLTYSVDGIMGRLNETVVESFVFVCDMPKISDEQCSRIILTPDEYNLTRDESDMFPPFITFADHVYNMSQFEWYNTVKRTIRICAPDWNFTSKEEVGQWTLVCGDDLVRLVVAESYLTFILGLISLVCLLSVLITYCMFEKLRNLPGINVMNLTLSLLLGELIFMISGWVQPHLWLCSAFGVILHFLFLASFFWMNVMAYDVSCTFSKANVLGRIRSKNKYVIKYLLYAWGCPLFIVGICCIIDFADIFENVSIGYGRSLITPKTADNFTQTIGNDSVSETSHIYSIGCWIQEPVASMIAFGGPMILILFSNAILFIQTIICIRANTKSTQDSIRRSSINNRVGHDDVMLYVRMSTVMGFTWIFGLASSVVSAFSGTPTRTSCIILHLLGILFIVFNCSQGIFIFFVFVFNRRVFALYRAYYNRLTQRRKTPVSVSSSCGTIHSTLSQSSLNRVT